MPSSKVSTNERLFQICFSIGNLRQCGKGRQHFVVYRFIIVGCTALLVARGGPANGQ